MGLKDDLAAALARIATLEGQLAAAKLGRTPTAGERAVAEDDAGMRSLATGEVLRNLDLAPLVLLRTYGAGVHVGRQVWRQGQESELVECRRIWQWSGANTLSEVATKGIDPASRLAQPTHQLLTSVTEVLEVTAAAAPSLVTSRWP